ncbi:unnamed protein product (macronuclear) [Paramecium tetraurelia]|uniref:Uncharacterized protein n=1 Tax=Paramecium tetraurelia TaxID=5888 RepID=A0DA57_PARTE|nr:uncharacterized protein GSPATT00014831001 [Paramecium tetraurelia]CAK79924.1 unnamed protein product [Paramecium tetraurelia]|eukprot:XP_001447321.1 hypothetical protein (macronuclear) [Paramecium tetraurelia strain d4-2]
MSKQYKDIRANFVFDVAPKSTHQSNDEMPIVIKQSDPIKIDKQQQDVQEINQQRQQNFDEEKLKSYQKMYEMCQQLYNDKAQLIDAVDQQQKQILELERQINEFENLQANYEKEQMQLKEEQLQYVQEIETLTCQLQVVMAQKQDINQMQNNYDELYDQLMNFLYQENLQELINDQDKSNKKMIVQFLVEYLINQYVQKKNQEEKFQIHIQDNIQIIYDLQSKIQDLTCNPYRITTPKSVLSDTLKQSKLSSSASHFHKTNSVNANDKEELQSKIDSLKRQGKQINKKWQEFCENILRERNDVIKYHKKQIESIAEQNLELKKTISEIIQYLGQSQQDLWIQMLDIKQKIHLKVIDLSRSDNVNQLLVEAELKQLFSIQAQLRSQLNRNRPLRKDLQ